MKTRIFASMLVIALAAALVGGATMAFFTDTETVASNTLTAGTVNITVGAAAFSTPNFGNMAPGCVRTGSFVVNNVGTLELRINVTATGSGDLFTAQGPAPSNTPAFITLTDHQNIVIPPGDSRTVNFSVTLPITAGNYYQGDTGTVTFTINAVQTAHNPVTP